MTVDVTPFLYKPQYPIGRGGGGGGGSRPGDPFAGGKYLQQVMEQIRQRKMQQQQMQMMQQMAPLERALVEAQTASHRARAQQTPSAATPTYQLKPVYDPKTKKVVLMPWNPKTGKFMEAVGEQEPKKQTLRPMTVFNKETKEWETVMVDPTTGEVVKSLGKAPPRMVKPAGGVFGDFTLGEEEPGRPIKPPAPIEKKSKLQRVRETFLGKEKAKPAAKAGISKQFRYPKWWSDPTETDLLVQLNKAMREMKADPNAAKILDAVYKALEKDIPPSEILEFEELQPYRK